MLVKKASSNDLSNILKILKELDKEGEFFYERNRKFFNYDLFNEKILKEKIEKDDFWVLLNNGSIKGFSHWEKHFNYFYNAYTAVKEKGKGYGKLLYEYALKNFLKERKNFYAEFVSTNSMHKIYNFWKTFGIKPFGFLLGIYENSFREIFSSVIAGKCFSFSNKKIFVPKRFGDFVKNLCEINNLPYEIKFFEVKVEKSSKDWGNKVLVDFSDLEKSKILCKQGYVFSGILPEFGCFYHPFEENSLESLEKRIKDKELKNLFQIYLTCVY